MANDRILVIDDDEAIAELVKDALEVVHFDVTACTDPADAVVEAKNARFTLVISDVDMPGMNGFQCRDRIRQIPGYANTKWLFMSSADQKVEMEIVARIGDDKLLLKPFRPAELRRTVFALLEPVNVEKGPLPGALGPILHRVASQSESGVLTAVAGTRMKRIVFQEGRIVFAASNDPRDLIGQALLRSGLIKEKDLLDAFSMSGMEKDSSGAPFLGAALTAMRKVTPEQTQSVFVGKIRESVLELFLWFEGQVEYVAGAIDSGDRPFGVTLESEEIRAEGERRREKWKRVLQILPDSTVTFKRVKPAWPDEMQAKPGDKLLAKLIDKGMSMAQILLELRGQDYAAGVRLATLVLQKVIKPKAPAGFRPIKPVKVDTVPDGETLDVTEGTFSGPGAPQQLADDAILAQVEVPDESQMLERLRGAGAGTDNGGATPAAPRAEPSMVGAGSDPAEQPSAIVVLLTRGLGAFRLGDLTTARAAFEEVLARDPLNPLARQRIGEVDAAAALAARAAGLTNDVRIGLGVTQGKLPRQISANDAFVLNRLAGSDRTIGELLQLCPMTEREVLSVVQRYLKMGVLSRRA